MEAPVHTGFEERHVLKRPIELEADVVRFQNNKEKWIAFVGLIDGRPYEIFTGLADDEDGIFCPKSVSKGKSSRLLTRMATSAMIFSSSISVDTRRQ